MGSVRQLALTPGNVSHQSPSTEEKPINAALTPSSAGELRDWYEMRQIGACGGDRSRLGIYVSQDVKAFFGKSSYVFLDVDLFRRLATGIVCSSLFLFEKVIAPIEIECHSWAWVTLLAIR